MICGDSYVGICDDSDYPQDNRPKRCWFQPKRSEKVNFPSVQKFDRPHQELIYEVIQVIPGKV